MATIDISYDALLIDNQVAVDLELKRDGTTLTEHVENAHKTPITRDEAEALGARVTGQEASWFIPARQLEVEGIDEVREGDVITECDELTAWTVRIANEVSAGKILSGWRCVCNKRRTDTT